ncbi:MAG: chloride channel protein [Alphaproteobacteria bacterium]|jgi:H+/Cl- antiporter ClcA|nr:chloride channel protein [Alphaproteobacteria bacterium]
MHDRSATLRRHRLLLLSRRHWKMRLVLWGGALTVGVVSVAFAWAANRAQDVFSHILFNPWLALLITPLGFVACAFGARTVFAGAQGSGIPQAIAARHLKDDAARARLLSLRLTIGKILLTLIGLLCGASIGREGPTVQVGASLMLGAARLGGLARERGLILAGSAAGVAAAFNTPLAGIVFAIEEMSRAFESRTSGLVLIAVILAGLASLGLVGNYSYFGHSTSMLKVTIDWVAVPVCGVLGGLLGALFAWLVTRGTTLIRAWTRVAPLRRALLLAGACGLTVALCGLASGGATYGTGYDAARGAIEGHMLAADYAPLKFLATLASTLSGIPGGLFAPSLSVGAGMGEIVAHLLGVHAVGAIVLLGMAGYFSGVVQAPITSFVIIGEMSGADGMVIPLMLAAVIAYGVSKMFQRQSLYHALAQNFLTDLRR